MFPIRFFTSSSYTFSFLLVAIAIVTGSWNHLATHSNNEAGDAAYHLAVTSHRSILNGKVLNYQATAGYLSLGEKTGQSADIFYVAYTSTNAGPVGDRPITFVFNGGPGSASIWLHMGSFGPVKVELKDNKNSTPATAGYADNPYTWLNFTDLVFIDPVSTGYSRPGENVDARHFYNYTNDIASIGEFITSYLAQNHRESSPKFLAGESYGAVRAIGLAAYLQDKYKIKLQGITLISPALNYQLISFRHGNETPYGYYLPSYALAAQYHHRLAPELQKLTREQLIAKTSAFAQGTYTLFLNQGDQVSQQLTDKVIDSLNYFTGLPIPFLIKANGRITDSQFIRALLQRENTVVGTFDSRLTGKDKTADPSETNLRGPFTTSFANYIRHDLKYQNELAYNATIAVGTWNYGSEANNSYLDVSETLKKIMVADPGLKINIATGYYDLATPVGTTEYVLRHLGLTPQLRANISLHQYPSGHMVYIGQEANAKFKTDAEGFYQNALAN